MKSGNAWIHPNSALRHSHNAARKTLFSEVDYLPADPPRQENSTPTLDLPQRIRSTPKWLVVNRLVEIPPPGNPCAGEARTRVRSSSRSHSTYTNWRHSLCPLVHRIARVINPANQHHFSHDWDFGDVYSTPITSPRWLHVG
jgi:hypothetical protein